jgi:hypothetical protein
MDPGRASYRALQGAASCTLRSFSAASSCCFCLCA